MVVASLSAFVDRIFTGEIGFAESLSSEPATKTPSRRPPAHLSDEMNELIRIRHRAHKTPIAAQAARAFTWQRDRGAVITKAYEGVTDEHKQALSDFETVFLPGFYNHPPGEDWYNKFAAASARASVISVSSYNRIVERDMFHIVGGDDATYNPEWTSELPTILCRLFVDLQMNANLRKNKRLLLIGHSKGGLLVYSLLALRKHYQDNGGHFSPDVLRFFPGLANVPSHVVHTVMTALNGAVGIALATPFFGLHPGFQAFTQKYRLDKISYNAPYYYSEEYLESLYAVLGRPEDFINGAVYARSNANSLPHLARNHLDRESLLAFVREPVVQGGRFLFDALAATITPDLPGDGVVVNPQPGHFPHELYVDDVNHIEIVIDEALAPRKLDFITGILRQ